MSHLSSKDRATKKAREMVAALKHLTPTTTLPTIVTAQLEYIDQLETNFDQAINPKFQQRSQLNRWPQW